MFVKNLDKVAIEISSQRLLHSFPLLLWSLLSITKGGLLTGEGGGGTGDGNLKRGEAVNHGVRKREKRGERTLVASVRLWRLLYSLPNG